MAAKSPTLAPGARALAASEAILALIESEARAVERDKKGRVSPKGYERLDSLGKFAQKMRQILDPEKIRESQEAAAAGAGPAGPDAIDPVGAPAVQPVTSEALAARAEALAERAAYRLAEEAKATGRYTAEHLSEEETDAL